MASGKKRYYSFADGEQRALHLPDHYSFFRHLPSLRFFYFLVVVVSLAGVGAVVRVSCVSLRREYTPWTRNRPAGILRLDASSSNLYLLCRGWKNVIDEVKVRGATKRDQEFSLLSYPASGRLPPGGLKPSPPPGLNTICGSRRKFLRSFFCENRKNAELRKQKRFTWIAARS